MAGQKVRQLVRQHPPITPHRELAQLAQPPALSAPSALTYGVGAVGAVGAVGICAHSQKLKPVGTPWVREVR